MNEVFGRTVAKISADCARSSVLKLGRTHENAHAAHGVLALDHHRQHRTAGHIGNRVREKRLIHNVCIMLTQDGLVQRNHLHLFDSVALSFDTGQDLTDQSTLQCIRFEHNIGALSCHLCNFLLYFPAPLRRIICPGQLHTN